MHTAPAFCGVWDSPLDCPLWGTGTPVSPVTARSAHEVFSSQEAAVAGHWPSAFIITLIITAVITLFFLVLLRTSGGGGLIAQLCPIL